MIDLNVRFGGGDGMIEAGLSQPLIDLLLRPARSRTADARLRASAQRAVIEALDILRETQQTYADAVGFRARRAGLDARPVRVRADRRSARLTLARLIERPSGSEEFRLEPATSPEPLAAEADYLATALAARPEVQAQVFELAALGEQVKLAGFTPFDEVAAGFETETEAETSIGPSVTLPIPIVDFGTQRRERARAEVLAARHRLTGVSRRVVEEVRRAIAAAPAADEGAEAIEGTLLPLQRDRVQEARAAYRAGFADVTDVLAAEQDLLDAEAELIDARLRREIADSDLSRATGGGPDSTQT